MRPLAILAGLYAVGMLATWLAALAVGAPFALWFDDAPLLLGALLAIVLYLGVVWDGMLLSSRWASRFLLRSPREGVPLQRRIGFFSCGVLPIPILLMTAYAILGTSNITLVNLQMLHTTTEWRDPMLWSIEAPLLTSLQEMSIDVEAWDRLYHSAWGIEVLAAFVLVLVARGPRIVLHYGATMIVLFYLGRLLGVVNPVMGPAFHRPDAFGYLRGSTTEKAMELVGGVLAQPIDQLVDRGGILLGGVSAMPSLHVAMVAATAFWLAAARRWTLAFTIPWVGAVWAATVMLGWHYVIDGAGGLVLAAVSVALTRALMRRLDPAPTHGGTVAAAVR